VLEQAELYSLL